MLHTFLISPVIFFEKNMVPELISDPKFGRRRGLVTPVSEKKKDPESRTGLRPSENFRNGVPWQKYPWISHTCATCPAHSTLHVASSVNYETPHLLAHSVHLTSLYWSQCALPGCDAVQCCMRLPTLRNACVITTYKPRARGIRFEKTTRDIFRRPENLTSHSQSRLSFKII
jgi:hypothetical protein